MADSTTQDPSQTESTADMEKLAEVAKNFTDNLDANSIVGLDIESAVDEAKKNMA